MDKKFVSRAGEKLEFALRQFHIDVKDKVCADLGSSTGGFTDCLLQNGAVKVYCVDTAYGQLDWNLRNNPKVVVMEKTNALHVGFDENMDFISIDVGWTPQKFIIPHALSMLKEDGNIVSLLKPHYEADRHWLRKGKLQEQFLEETVEKVKQELSGLDIVIKDIIKSPIVGGKGGNVEYLMWIKRNTNLKTQKFKNIPGEKI